MRVERVFGCYQSLSAKHGNTHPLPQVVLTDCALLKPLRYASSNSPQFSTRDD
jgi:hypothetical protein